MKRETVGIIAAMPEEAAPLVRLFSAKRLPGRQTFSGTCGRYDIVIVRSGMGCRHAVDGVRRLLDVTHPKLIVSCGVAGAVTPGPATGDVVVGTTILRFSREAIIPSLPPFIPEECEELLKGTVITTERIEPKEKVAALIGSSVPHPVLDMETAAVVEAAAEAGVQTLAIRGISDEAAEELKFSLDEFTDSELNLRISRVAGTVLRKPWIIPQLVRLARNTNLAAENVARGLQKILLRLEI